MSASTCSVEVLRSLSNNNHQSTPHFSRGFQYAALLGLFGLLIICGTLPLISLTTALLVIRTGGKKYLFGYRAWYVRSLILAMIAIAGVYYLEVWLESRRLFRFAADISVAWCVWGLFSTSRRMMRVAPSATGLIGGVFALSSSQTGLPETATVLIACSWFLLTLWLTIREQNLQITRLEKEHSEKSLKTTPPNQLGDRISFWSTIGPCLFTLLLMVLIYPAVIKVLPEVRKTLVGVVEQQGRIETGGRAFVRVATLTSVRQTQMYNPAGVALRVYTDRPPGYLRGRCFEHFNGWSWELSRSRRPQGSEQPLQPTDLRNSNLEVRSDSNYFQIRTGSFRRFRSYEIQGDPARGVMFFTPLNAAVIGGVGSFLEVDSNQIVRRGIDHRQPYVIGIPLADYRETIDEQLWPQYLQVPPSAVELQPIADEIKGGRKNTQDKIQKVEEFFRLNFEYTDELVTGANYGGSSPLVRFIKERHPAHCEYFSSATAILLRMMDVPTRLVIGYDVQQLSDSEDYYFARNQDAHAWVEAYDADRQRWILVEATPGRRVQREQTNNFEDEVLVLDDQTDSGGFAAAARQVFSFSFLQRLQPWARQSQVLNFTLTAFLTWLVIVLIRKSIQQRNTRRFDGETRHDLKDQYRLLRKHLKWLKHQGVVRNTSESWWGFAMRVDAAAQSADTELQQKMTSIATWLRTFAIQRYS